MRAMRACLGVGVTAATVVVAACSSSSSSSGSGSAGTLDCGWVGSDNCWKSTVAAAMGCLPAASDMGKLSADLKTCTYAKGQVVTFDQPLTLPLPDMPVWNFTLTAGGVACMRLQQSDTQHFTLTTNAGTASAGASGGAYVVSCPDGLQYTATDPFGLLTCDAGITELPGTEQTSSSTSVHLTLLGAPTPAGMPVFNCQM